MPIITTIYTLRCELRGDWGVTAMNSYLRIAEAVLRKSRQPLSASEILDTAYRFQLVPEHLFGKTQFKTLQARLSEDLLYNRRHTVFARTGPGRFVLRSQLASDSDVCEEYVAPLRSYQLKQFDVICADQSELDALWKSGSDKIPFSRIAKAFTRQLPLLQVESEATMVHLRILVTIRCLDQILTLAAINGSSLGPGRTLGIFGYLKGMDLDLFSLEPFGIDEAARRTVSEQSMAPQESVDELTQLIGYDSLQCLRLLDQDDAKNAVVLLTAYECDDPDKFISHIPSHRMPRWTRIPSEINDFNALEPVSRCLINQGDFAEAISL